MRRQAAALGVGVLLGGLPGPRLVAQGRVLDGGSFMLYRGEEAIGRETFTLRAGRPGAGDGFTISTSGVAVGDSSIRPLSLLLELGADTLPIQGQLDLSGDGQRRVYFQLGPRRVTIRIVRPNGESAREFPPADRQIVLVHSLVAAYILFPRAHPPVSALDPLSERRRPVRVTDSGPDRTTVEGVAHELRHVVLSAGDERTDLWYDRAGRLMKAIDAAAGVRAERAP